MGQDERPWQQMDSSLLDIRVCISQWFIHPLTAKLFIPLVDDHICSAFSTGSTFVLIITVSIVVLEKPGKLFEGSISILL